MVEAQSTLPPRLQKIVDMFGCRLPVLSMDYACISELVQDGRNGRLFRSVDSLAELMLLLVRSPEERARLRANAKLSSWDDLWNAVCAPVLLQNFVHS